jgi:hypothetical protein
MWKLSLENALGALSDGAFIVGHPSAVKQGSRVETAHHPDDEQNQPPSQR